MVDLDALQRRRAQLAEARLNDVREFQDQNGERVVYRSFAEMAAALAAIDREIAQAIGPQPSNLVFRTSKGL